MSTFAPLHSHSGKWMFTFYFRLLTVPRRKRFTFKDLFAVFPAINVSIFLFKMSLNGLLPVPRFSFPLSQILHIRVLKYLDLKKKCVD